MSVKETIFYMERMREWFNWIGEREDTDNPIYWGGVKILYPLTTMGMVDHLNIMINRYQRFGVSISEKKNDAVVLNIYRELYNKNKGIKVINPSMENLITTI